METHLGETFSNILDGFNELTGLGNLMPCKCPGSDLRHEEKEEETISSLSLHHPWLEVHRACGGFCDVSALGRKSDGSAFYRGQLTDGAEVAVKVFSRAVDPTFEREVLALSRVSHPNIVGLMGWSLEGASCSRGVVLPGDVGGGPLRTEPTGLSSRRQAAIVYELLPGGDALARLASQTTPYPWKDRLQTAHDVARGLSYMSTLRPPVFHRDIKTSNILFGPTGTAKIADFELVSSPRRGNDGLCHSVAAFSGGTPGYIAPECVRTGVVNEASEVYSMGMVLIELLTARAPAEPAKSARGGFTFLLELIRPELDLARDRVLSLVDPRGQWPWPTAASFAQFALTCICLDAELRPNFVGMTGKLRNVQDLPNSSEGEAVALACAAAVAAAASRSGADSDAGGQKSRDVDVPTGGDSTTEDRASATSDSGCGDGGNDAGLRSIRRIAGGTESGAWAGWGSWFRPRRVGPGTRTAGGHSAVDVDKHGDSSITPRGRVGQHTTGKDNVAHTTGSATNSGGDDNALEGSVGSYGGSKCKDRGGDGGATRGEEGGAASAAVAFYAAAAGKPLRSMSSAMASPQSPAAATNWTVADSAPSSTPLAKVEEERDYEHQEAPRAETRVVSRGEYCPKGHPMRPHVTSRASEIICDLCKQPGKKGKLFMCCRQCNWDVCEPCLKASGALQVVSVTAPLPSVDAPIGAAELSLSTSQMAAPAESGGGGDSSCGGSASPAASPAASAALAGAVAPAPVTPPPLLPSAAVRSSSKSVGDASGAAAEVTPPEAPAAPATAPPEAVATSDTASAATAAPQASGPSTNDQDEADLAFLVESALNWRGAADRRDRTPPAPAPAAEGGVNLFYPEHAGIGRLHHICEASP